MIDMKAKIGNDEFCLQCMEWREYDEEGRCKVCKHIIYRNSKKSENNGYSEFKTESPSYEFDGDDDFDY
jgi:NADH:ubiquinone oxidoreductase subunit